MRIAIVADWLTTFGGAEHVLAELAALYPEARLHATVTSSADVGPIARDRMRPTRLQTWLRILRKHQFLLPWMPQAIETIDLRGNDVILSSSHAVGKGIVPPDDAVHVCYCHTPMRYAWEMEEKYLDDFRVPRFLRPMIRRRLRDLRRWDLSTSKRVDVFLCNSRETQERILRTYGREATVIPPPVHDRFFDVPLRPMRGRESFLAVGRLVPYKRFDLLVEVANALKLPLTIVGIGQERNRLRRMAGPTVTFRGFVPENELPALYASAKAVLFPQHEDAGIVPIEAQASGTPVIALGIGGARDTVQDGTTGIFFAEQTAGALTEALERFSAMTFDPAAIREHARRFGSEGFRTAIDKAVRKAHEDFR